MNAARLGLRPSAVALTQSGRVVARAGVDPAVPDGHRDNPAQPRTLAQVALFPAVQLFAARAARVMPGFALTEVDMAAVMGIDYDDRR